MTPKNLSNALRSVDYRWEEVGIQLDIPPSAISSIHRIKNGNVYLCMLGLINHWLRTDILASWEKLAQALERLQENSVAADIREKYISSGGKLL